MSVVQVVQHGTIGLLLMPSKLHHYVPQLILREFVTDRAWEVVSRSDDVRARVRDDDSRAVTNAQSRNRPIITLNAKSGVMSRSLVGRTCAKNGLYDVGVTADPMIRASIRSTLHRIRQGQRHSSKDFEEFLMLGRAPIAADEIERLDTAPFDGDFASLLMELRTRRTVWSDDEVEFILRYFYFSRWRTPWFKEANFGRNSAPVLVNMTPSRRDEYRRLEQEELVPRGLRLRDVIRSLFAQQYAATMAQLAHSRMPEAQQSPTRILVLTAGGTMRFIATDNPARPWPADHPLRARYTPAGRYGDRGAIAVLPIAPNLCIALTRRPAGPGIEFATLNDSQVRRINTGLIYTAVSTVILPEPCLDVFDAGFDLSRWQPPKWP